MPTSRSPFGVNIAPLPFPDFQTDINKQLSFWNTMQQMQRRAAGISGGGGRVPRNENGLTPWQQLQADEKKAKAEAKAAEAEAKKNVMLGLDPVTKEPIIYRNESGQNLTQKDRDRLLADELQRRLKNAAGQDVELNKALGELNSGTELSTQRRSELQRVVRDRTKALGREYGIDDRATFDAIIGPSKQVLDEQRQALSNDSFLDTVWAGMRKGGNALYYAATMPFMSDAERLEAAEQMRKEQEAITRSSPTLQERALVEAEAAREGKDVGYMQAAQANLASNIGASVADTVTSFAPAIAAGMIPVVGAYAAPVLAGGIGAGLNQVSQAARVEADPNLTEAQKQQALSYSDPGFVGTTVLGGATGAMFPGSIGSGIARGVGSAAFRRAAAAGPINPATVPGLTGRALRAGARATERAQAPRSLAALSRDVPVNMAENAGLMAANTVGANMAYNASVGQPLTQGAMEGVGRAAMEGAIIGVPFGVGRTLRRQRAPEAPVAERSAATTTETQPNIEHVVTIQNRPAGEWRKELNTAVNKTKVDEAGANKLIAEYLSTGTEAPETLHSRLNDLQNIPVGKGLTPRGKKVLTNLLKEWEGAETDGTITEKINGLYQPAGESRLTANVGEPERAGTERPAGQGSGNDSKVATNPADSASDVASGNPVQNNAGGAETPGGGNGGPATQDGRPPEAPSAASPQAGREGTPAGQQPANAGSTGTGGKSSGNGAGELAPSTVGRDGSTGNAATPSGGEQSAGGLVITYRPNGTHTYDYAPRHDVLEVEGKAGKSVFFRKKGEKLWRVYNPNAKKFYSVVSRDVWDNTPDDIREIGKNYSAKNGGIASKVMSKALTELADSEAAKSTNPKGEIRESRALREPRQTKKVYKLMRIKRDEQGNVQRDENGNPVLYPLFVGNDEPIKIGTTYSADSPDFSFLRALPDGDWRVDMTTGEAQSWADYAAANNIKRRSPNKDDINAATATGSRWMRIKPTKNVQKNSGDKRTYHNIGLNGSGEVATFALRPGWHTTDVPTARQIKVRNDDHVWVEGSIAAERDYTSVDANGNYRDMISMPRDNDTEGFYHYYTSANAKQGNGDWYISSTFRPERIISDAEARSAVDAANTRWNGSRHAEYDNPRASGREFTGFDTVNTSRESRRFAEAPVLSDKLVEKYFRTPEEKAVLAALRDKTTDAATYQNAVEQFANIVMSRFPGLKKRDLVMLPYSREANATYDPVSGNIGLNPGRIWDASDSVAASLNFMTHELRGHAATNELLSPTARRDLYGTAYRGATEAQRSDAITLYGDTAISAETAGKTSRGAYIGEEIYSEFHAANGADPFVINGDVRRDILDFYSLTPVNATERVQAMQKILDFLATRADDNTFKEFATSAILSSKEHVDAFTGSESKLLQLQDDGAVSASMVKMIEDYRDLTKTYGVERNKETLGIYLDELLDPETALDVFKRQSVVC